MVDNLAKFFGLVLKVHCCRLLERMLRLFGLQGLLVFLLVLVLLLPIILMGFLLAGRTLVLLLLVPP